jgi:DNA-binding transcriptional ArsR family regulator
MNGDELVEVLAVLANPHRLRVLAALAEQSDYVSRLARTLGISRPLLQMHLRRLEAAGLVSAHMELSEDGKAMNFYRVQDFSLELTPHTIRHLAASLSPPADVEKKPPRLSRKDADS